MRRRLTAPFAVPAALAVASLVGGLLAPPAMAFTTPNDPDYSRQWGMQIIGAPQAWAANAIGTGVTIGIVDTGIDLLHEDLQGKIVASTSCIGASGDYHRCSGSAQDDNGHGTHVAGIAAANTNNGLGVAGVAPGAKLVIARALAGQSNDSASGSGDDIIAGIEWVIHTGHAQVVNLSLGDSTVVSSIFGSSLTDEINKVWTTDHVVVVVAAGNNGGIFGSEYANTDAVVVTATDRSDHVASYASSDSSLVGSVKWGMAAPGGAATDSAATCQNAPNDIFSTLGYVNNPAQGNGSFHQYGCLAGTSMAAPHVAGAAAVLLGLGVPYNQVPDRLVSTAKPISGGAAGHGRLDLAKAVSGLAPASLPGVTSAGGGVQGGSSSTSHRTARRIPAAAPTATSSSPTTATAAPSAASDTRAAASAPKVEAATVRRAAAHHNRQFPWAVAVLAVGAVAGGGVFAARRRRVIP